MLLQSVTAASYHFSTETIIAMTDSFNPMPLRAALWERRMRQVMLARLSEIPETRLSRILNGHVDAEPWEKKAIAKVLRKPIAHLFPTDGQEAIA